MGKRLRHNSYRENMINKQSPNKARNASHPCKDLWHVSSAQNDLTISSLDICSEKAVHKGAHGNYNTAKVKIKYLVVRN